MFAVLKFVLVLSGALLPQILLGQSSLYYVTFAETGGALTRAAITGLEPKMILALTSSYPGRVAVDPLSGTLYFSLDGTINSLRTSGGSKSAIVPSSFDSSTPLALDSVNRRILFLSSKNGAGVYAAPLSGGEVTKLLELQSTSQIGDLKVDSASKYLYMSITPFTDDLPRIDRYDLKSGVSTTVVELPGGISPALSTFSIDSKNKAIFYCVNDTSTSLYRVPLEGPGAASLVGGPWVTPCTDSAIDELNGVLYLATQAEEGGIRAYPLATLNLPITLPGPNSVLAIAVEPIRGTIQITPATKPAPAVVEVKQKAVVILMERFVSSSSTAVAPPGGIIEAARKPWATYRLEVKANGSKRLIRRETRRNKYTLRNLRAGSYSVRYRVSSRRNGKTNTSRPSGARSFTVQ